MTESEVAKALQNPLTALGITLFSALAAVLVGQVL